ncbi:hypothetical protein ACS0TY_030451 [Phlomoides rotata]
MFSIEVDTQYATGDEDDEKVHKSFHKDYTHGIPFKVQDVVQMMEMELGEGWILNSNCISIYFITKNIWMSCCEPIKKAYTLISSSVDEKHNVSPKKKKCNSTTLQFGGVTLHREIIRKDIVKRPKEDSHDGMIQRANEALPAVCGIRAIWVTPSNMRKHIASSLLDAARRSFCKGMILNRTQLAFSQLTSLGKALISSYSKTTSILLYTTANMN